MNLCYFVFFAIFTTKFQLLSKLNIADVCLEDEKRLYIVVGITKIAE